MLLALVAVLATLAPDLCAVPMRHGSWGLDEFAPAGSRTDGNLNVLGSPSSFVEELEEEFDEGDPEFLAASHCGCHDTAAAMAAAAASLPPLRRASAQFATGPPIL